jgi:ADP-heptose:LPS heptosyltransferase
MPRILISRMHRLGDVLMVLPVIQGLAASGFEVDLITSDRYLPLLEGHASLRRAFSVSFDPSKPSGMTSYDGRYNVAIDLHSNRQWEPEANLFLERVRAPVRIAVSPSSPVRPTHVREGRRHDEHAIAFYVRVIGPDLVGRLGDGRLEELVDKRAGSSGEIALVPGVHRGKDSWPTAKFAELGERLAKGRDVVIVGSGPDAASVNAVAGQCHDNVQVYLSSDLRSVARRLSASELVVANNSGLAHVAAAVGRPVVCIYSGVNPSKWAPWGRSVSVVGDRWGTAAINAFETLPPSASEASVQTVLEAVTASLEIWDRGGHALFRIVTAELPRQGGRDSGVDPAPNFAPRHSMTRPAPAPEPVVHAAADIPAFCASRIPEPCTPSALVVLSADG